MKHSKKILTFGLAASMMAVPCAQALEMPNFADVPDDHWAKPAITEMAICKVMEGVGDNCFAPNQQITYAEWAKMICLTFYGHKMVEGTGDAWYADYIATVDSLGLFDKATNYDSANPYIPANRYDVAQIVYKVLTDKYVVWRQDKAERSEYEWGLDFGKFNIDIYSSIITDWRDIPEAHKEAVARSYWAGILNGMDDGSYAGNTYLTRAQAAKILSKLAEVCDANVTAGGSYAYAYNSIYQKIENGADRRDFVASTPVKYVTRLTQTSYEGVRENGKGGFVLDGTGMFNGVPSLSIKTKGYTTVSFTITAIKDVWLWCTSDRAAGPIEVTAEDVESTGIYGSNTVLLEKLPAGTAKEFTIDVTGSTYFSLRDYNLSYCAKISELILY